MKKIYFVTATNTDVGKTYTTIQLMHEYAARGMQVGVLKLIETGVVDGVYPDGDVLLKHLKELNPECVDLSVEDIVPISYELPAAPYIASGGEMLDFEILQNSIENMEKRCDILLIEGAGGLMVPVDYSFTIIDLIGFFSANALLVTHCNLGCINDTLLSQMALENKNITTVTAFNCRGGNENFAKLSEPYFLKKVQKVFQVGNDISAIADEILASFEAVRVVNL